MTIDDLRTMCRALPNVTEDIKWGHDLCFLIGGPRGLPDEVLALAEERVSFGPQTMAHQLARVALLEQLFRAAKILAGEPYHR